MGSEGVSTSDALYDDMGLCSIIVATHNRIDLAQRAIQSALDQSYRAIEVIVVDDGSVQPFKSDHEDDRIKLVRNEFPIGVNGARNMGLAVAAGAWITFLDDDDELDSDFVRHSLATARSSALPSPVCILSGIQPFYPDGRPIPAGARYPVSIPKGGHYFLEEWRLASPRQSFRTHNTLVAPVDFLRHIGGFDPSIRAWAHNDLFLRLNAIASIDTTERIGYYSDGARWASPIDFNNRRCQGY